MIVFTYKYLELKWPLFWHFWLEQALFWEVSLPNIEGKKGLYHRSWWSFPIPKRHRAAVAWIILSMLTLWTSVFRFSPPGGTSKHHDWDYDWRIVLWFVACPLRIRLFLGPPSKFDVFMYGLGVILTTYTFDPPFMVSNYSQPTLCFEFGGGVKRAQSSDPTGGFRQ